MMKYNQNLSGQVGLFGVPWPWEVKKMISQQKQIIEVDRRRKYLEKNAVSEIRPIFQLFKNTKMTKEVRYTGYGLLESMNRKWPPGTKKLKKLYAKNLLLIKNSLPEYERNAYESSLKGMLTHWWKLTEADLKVTSKIITTIVIVGLIGTGIIAAILGYKKYVKPVIH